MKLRHFFLPHPHTHKKAHLISAKALVVYILLFVFLQTGFKVINRVNPEVLGINSSITTSEVISLVNSERAKRGLGQLTEDSRLASAANAKGENMFEENYWAHFSPSGKDPWGFINGAGYKFKYAGENLAKNFYTSPEVVNAWMASPTHRENILNPNYKNIGIAVLEGNLQGQQTVLVVQEFGAPFEALAQAESRSTVNNEQPTEEIREDSSTALAQSSSLPSVQPVAAEVGVIETQPQTLVAGQQSGGAVLDPYGLTKNLGLGIFGLLIFLIALDLYIMRRRAVTRLASRHLPHLAILSVAAGMLLNSSPGVVL